MDTPSSPPAGPVIPRGLATNVGLIAGAIAAIAAGVAAIVDGDHTPETLGALLTAGGIIYGVIRGRMDQAAAALMRPPAAILPAPAPTVYLPGAERAAVGLEDPLLDDPDALEEEPMLSDEDLAGRSTASEHLDKHVNLAETDPPAPR